MTINVNWATVGTGLILLCLVVATAAAWYFIDRQRVMAEDRRQLRDFEREMADVQLPPWDGTDYEWPADLAAYLNDPYAYTEAPVPPSTVSGPLPALDDTEAFIAAMRAQTDARIAAFKALDPVA